MSTATAMARAAIHSSDVVTMWHGTTEEAAKAIQREGLKPMVKGRFDFINPLSTEGGLRKDRNTPEFVFLAGREEDAEFFAKFRVLYLSAPVGKPVKFSLESGRGMLIERQASEEVVTGVKPVIMRFEIPREVLRTLGLERDPDDIAEDAYRIRGCVPAEYVKEVVPLKLGKGDGYKVVDERYVEEQKATADLFSLLGILQ